MLMHIWVLYPVLCNTYVASYRYVCLCTMAVKSYSYLATYIAIAFCGYTYRYDVRILKGIVLKEVPCSQVL